MPRWPIFTVFNLLLLSSRVFGEELELKVEFPRQAYVLGDGVDFKIAYSNTTQRTLTILPNIYAYRAQLLRCQRVSDGKLAKVIRFVELSIDFEALSRESVQLGPSQTYAWPLSAKLSSSLPRFMHSNRRGIYLVFPGSALELPGPGEDPCHYSIYFEP